MTINTTISIYKARNYLQRTTNNIGFTFSVGYTTRAVCIQSVSHKTNGPRDTTKI